ncbi:hypothetical protein C9374_008079 [Naegleria lovaniensis]|uniref:Peptidase S53 domain-containing protein n=1 Tax=Naegleria lovaniensis TaxID=51637 RepID=A0AA88GKK3_NAELO|nr:uncharacterized protein C9374_008079 [Naegleria lovaniensis]KAG2378440.1 hypothetical protein C9374_008079 [Naegleria lovaniensis]
MKQQQILSLLLLSLLALTCSLAAQEQQQVSIHHPTEFKIPPGWRRFFDHSVSSMHPQLSSFLWETQKANVTFSLHSQNTEWLREQFESVSDPFHPKFRKFLSMEQVARMTSPHASHKQLVMEFIKKSLPGARVMHVSAHENFVTVEAPLKTLNEAFKARMVPFVHEETGRMVYRSEIGYALPVEISSAVHAVFGLHHFPIYSAKIKSVRSVETPNVRSRAMQSYDTTPQALWKRYNITLPTSTSPKNQQAVASFLGQYVELSDLTQFQQMFNLPRVKPTIIGPNDQSQPGTEAALDIQYITAVGYLVNTTINSNDPNDQSDDIFLRWIKIQQSMGDRSAWVHSVSYGGVEKYVPKNFQTTLDIEFQKFGVTGRTVLIASGDDGSRCNSNGDKFEAEWPTSSPYIVSVGATRPSDTYFERAVSWGGGGFAESYARPSYQSEAVSQYLRGNSVPPTSYFNVNGRAYPDVAALGVDYQIVVGGQVQAVDGTSASTPVFAGIVSLLNDLRLKAGKQPLGFLNPWLYQVASKERGAFFDITQGNNGVSPCPGFSATQGYDPISGLGVPNFEVLRRLAVQSP